MNMHRPFNLRASLKARQDAKRANLVRAAEELTALSFKPDSPWQQLRFLDALRFCSDSHLNDGCHAEMRDLLFELRLSEDGFPLDDSGDVIVGAERRYVPMTELGCVPIGGVQ